jgi:hypothetical protein
MPRRRRAHAPAWRSWIPVPCPICGTYKVTSALLGCGIRLPTSTRDDLVRLRGYGYRPLVEFNAHDGIRIGPSKSPRS